MYFLSLKLGHRLLLCAALAIAAIVCVGAISLFVFAQAKVNGPIYRDLKASADLLADVLPPPLFIVEAHLAVHQAALAGDAPTRARCLTDVARLQRAYDERVKGWAQVLPPGETRTALTVEGVRLVADYFAAIEREYVPALRSGDPAAAARIIHDTLEPLYERHQAAVLQVVKQAEAGIALREQRAAAWARGGFIAIVACSLCAAVVAVLMAIAVSRGMVGSVENVKRVLAGLSLGDLRLRAMVAGRDELAAMARDLNTSMDALRSTVGAIHRHVDGLSGAAGSMAGVSRDLNGSAEESAAQASQAAAAATQISTSIGSIAAGMEEMGASITEIARGAGEAATVAGDGVAASTQAKMAMEHLRSSSQEVGEIVQVIKGIAAQTNLLALNAAIEAAQAGEAGRGFAIVAGEVKDLAQRTAAATADVDRRIGAIQSDSRAADEAIMRINALVERINQLQQSIASAVEEQSSTAGELTRNIAQVAQAGEDISRNVVSVADAAKQVSRGAGEVQAASDAVARVSADLRDSTACFRLP